MSITTTAAERAGESALDFHKRTLIFDSLSLYYILDEPYAERVLEGGVNATNVTFAVEEDWPTTVKNIELGLQKIDKHPLLTLATCADDVLGAKAAGKLAVIMGTQGASMIDRPPSVYTNPEGTAPWRMTFDRLGLMYRLGLRFFGLTYTAANIFGDGCGEKRNGGLTFYGEELIDAVNGLPLMLDLSHCGHQTRWEAANRARTPVCTHSNAYGLNPNDRNTRDETAKLIAGKGGVLGVCALPRTVDNREPTLDRLVDHVDYYVKLVGIDHVGIGLDFTEAYQERQQVLPDSRRWRTLRPDVFGSVDDFVKLKYPLESIRLLPRLTQGLFDRGYDEGEVSSIIGGNWLRAFKAVCG